jgi:VanZ family protein
MARDAIARIGARTPAWLLPVTWMGLIMLLSTDLANAQRTGRFLIPLLQWALPWSSPVQVEALHVLARKAGHFLEYAVLGALWFRVLARHRSPGAATWLVLAIALGWATLDEIHQFFVPSRGASVVDVALDTAGAAVAVTLLQGGWRIVDVATTSLLWVAFAGGALVLAVNLYADVPSGVLWVSAPAAMMALALRWRRGRTRPPGPGAATP